MARIRTIKPELPHSESMGKVSRDARLAFILLWTIADDHGRLRGNSRMLASLLFPYDDDAPKLIDKWLDQLEAVNCIARYVVAGAQYIQVMKWTDHQRVDKPSASRFPEFDEASRRFANAREASGEDQGRDQGAEDSRIKEGKGARARVTLSDLSVDHIADWLAEKRATGKYIQHDPHFILEQFKNYCQSKGKMYADYIAGYRNAFEWDRCQPRGKQGGTDTGKSKWISAAEEISNRRFGPK